MGFSCDTCSGTQFHAVDGFFYCQECGTQSQAQQVEMEADLTRIGDRTISGDVVTLQKQTNDEARITSWEEYNYIMVGLVDEVINLGAKYKLKKMVLKLWARYLQTIEAAFFSIDDECLPRLPANYQKRDAEILYNKHHKKRKRRRSSCGSSDTGVSKTSTGKADSVIKSFNISKILKKTKEELARAQYEDYKKFEDDSSSLASSLATSSTQQSDKSVNLKLEFTRNARRVLKRKMCKPHLEKHASDYEDDLECHQERPTGRAHDKVESLSSAVLLSIIYLALNLTEDDIQWADLIRFLREGHISYFNIQHFLPENIKAEGNSNFERLSQRNIFYHKSMRQFTAKLSRDMSIQSLVKPDLSRLANRYIDDLGLPNELKEIVDKFIKYRPPVMNFSGETKFKAMVPNYEGRAIVYIVFVLKLLFGLDDQREIEMSNSAQKINNLLEEQPESQLFVITDWLKMLKVRRMVLEKHHMPSGLRREWDEERFKTNAQMFSDHIKNVYERKMPTERQKKSSSDGCALANNTLQLLRGLAERNIGEYAEEKTVSHSFSASLRPCRDYTVELLISHSSRLPLFNGTVEQYLRQDFQTKDIKVFYKDQTKLDSLKTILKSVRLEVEELNVDNRKLEFVKINTRFVERTSIYEKLKVEFVKENELEVEKEIKETKRTVIKRPVIKRPDKKGVQTETISEDPHKVTLKVNNMDYWVYFTNVAYEPNPYLGEGYEDMMERLPNNYKFLMFECARIVEQQPRWLFLEMAILERGLLPQSDAEGKFLAKFW